MAPHPGKTYDQLFSLLVSMILLKILDEILSKTP